MVAAGSWQLFPRIGGAPYHLAVTAWGLTMKESGRQRLFSPCATIISSSTAAKCGSHPLTVSTLTRAYERVPRFWPRRGSGCFT